jgi:hypothetical protein
MKLVLVLFPAFCLIVFAAAWLLTGGQPPLSWGWSGRGSKLFPHSSLKRI